MLKFSIAALALVAGSTFALADPNGGARPSAPGADGVGMERSGGSSKEFGGQMKEDRGSRDLGPASAKKNSAADEGARDRMKSDHQQANDRDLQGKDRQAKDEDRNLKGKASDRADRNDRYDRGDKTGAAERSKNDRSSTGSSEGTEGKGGPKGSVANVSSEQKTRVRSAFASHRVAPARNVGVAVNVGVVIPSSVQIYSVPDDIVTIVPDYRGYEYFMVDENHVAIVDPDTLEVVDIIVVA